MFVESNLEDKADFISCWPRAVWRKREVSVYEEFGVSMGSVILKLSKAAL